MISTLLIGGGVAANTFMNIPLCTKPDQFGCAIGYRTYGAPTPPTGTAVSATLACTNPAALGGGKAITKGAYSVSKGSNYAPALGADFPAHFGLFRNFFSAECKGAPSGGKYLEIAYAKMDGDPQRVPRSRPRDRRLHVFD